MNMDMGKTLSRRERSKQRAEVGKGGKKRLETMDFYRLNCSYYRINRPANRFLPHITACYRITFFWGQAGGDSPQRRGGAEGSAELCGKGADFYAFLRVRSFFGKTRPERGINVKISDG